MHNYECTTWLIFNRCKIEIVAVCFQSAVFYELRIQSQLALFNTNSQPEENALLVHSSFCSYSKKFTLYPNANMIMGPFSVMVFLWRRILVFIEDLFPEWRELPPASPHLVHGRDQQRRDHSPASSGCHRLLGLLHSHDPENVFWLGELIFCLILRSWWQI